MYISAAQSLFLKIFEITDRLDSSSSASALPSGSIMRDGRHLFDATYTESSSCQGTYGSLGSCSGCSGA
jgi:hypothetical protein